MYQAPKPTAISCSGTASPECDLTADTRPVLARNMMNVVVRVQVSWRVLETSQCCASVNKVKSYLQGCPNATTRFVRNGDADNDEVKLAFCRANMLPADTCALSGDGPLVKHLPKTVPSTKVFVTHLGKQMIGCM